MSQIGYGLATSLAYPSGEEGGNFLIQMIRVEEGGEGLAPCAFSLFKGTTLLSITVQHKIIQEPANSRLLVNSNNVYIFKLPIVICTVFL
jgi:hypothetical protein